MPFHDCSSIALFPTPLSPINSSFGVIVAAVVVVVLADVFFTLLVSSLIDLTALVIVAVLALLFFVMRPRLYVCVLLRMLINCAVFVDRANVMKIEFR